MLIFDLQFILNEIVSFDHEVAIAQVFEKEQRFIEKIEEKYAAKRDALDEQAAELKEDYEIAIENKDQEEIDLIGAEFNKLSIERRELSINCQNEINNYINPLIPTINGIIERACTNYYNNNDVMFIVNTTGSSRKTQQIFFPNIFLPSTKDITNEIIVIAKSLKIEQERVQEAKEQIQKKAQALAKEKQIATATATKDPQSQSQLKPKQD